MNFDRFQPPEECKPRYDSDGDALNCMECDQKGCDYYWQVHDEFEEEDEEDDDE